MDRVNGSPHSGGVAEAVFDVEALGGGDLSALRLVGVESEDALFELGFAVEGDFGKMRQCEFAGEQHGGADRAADKIDQVAVAGEAFASADQIFECSEWLAA